MTSQLADTYWQWNLCLHWNQWLARQRSTDFDSQRGKTEWSIPGSILTELVLWESRSTTEASSVSPANPGSGGKVLFSIPIRFPTHGNYNKADSNHILPWSAEWQTIQILSVIYWQIQVLPRRKVNTEISSHSLRPFLFRPKCISWNKATPHRL